MSQETRHEIIEGIMEGSYPIDPREQSTTDARNKRHSARCNDSETNLQSYLFVMHNVFCVTTNTRIQPNHIMHLGWSSKNSEETVVCMGLIVDKIMSVFDIYSEELYLD